MKRTIKLNENDLTKMIKHIIKEEYNMFDGGSIDRDEFEEAVGEYYDFSQMTPEQWEQINNKMVGLLRNNGIDYGNMSEEDYDLFCQMADSVAKEVGIPEYGDSYDNLNENKIKALVREAVDELKYSTYKSAHKKMQDRGQEDRAQDFMNTFNDVYGTRDTENGQIINYDLDFDEVNMKNQETPAIAPQYGVYRRGKGLQPWPNNPTNCNLRTSDRKKANKFAKAINFYNDTPGEKSTKDQFIAESVDRAFEKLFK